MKNHWIDNKSVCVGQLKDFKRIWPGKQYPHEDGNLYPEQYCRKMTFSLLETGFKGIYLGQNVFAEGETVKNRDSQHDERVSHSEETPWGKQHLYDTWEMGPLENDDDEDDELDGGAIIETQ